MNKKERESSLNKPKISKIGKKRLLNKTTLSLMKKTEWQTIVNLQTRRLQAIYRSLPNFNTERESCSQSVRLEGTISNINSDQTDSYFKIGSESKKISDNKKIDNGSGCTSKEYEEEKIQSIEEPAYISNEKQNKRANYSKEITNILNNWLECHIHFPYPTEEERIELCRKTGLTRKQIRIWFINTRKVFPFISKSLNKSVNKESQNSRFRHEQERKQGDQ